MAQTVVGLIENASEAEKTVEEGCEQHRKAWVSDGLRGEREASTITTSKGRNAEESRATSP